MSQRPECTPPGDIPSFAEVFELVLLVARKLRRVQSRVTAESSVAPAQYAVLCLLWERDRRTLGELASEHRVSRATMTGHMDALERQGLVTRVPNPDDRRSLLAALTDRGAALRDEAPDLASIFETCCADLSPAQLTQLRALLEKLERSLGF